MKKPYRKRLWYGVSYPKVKYSKNKIEKAGRAIARNDFSEISETESRLIINNWRAAHASPLQTFYVNCSDKASRFPNAIAVQRLKRLDSIVSKLNREPQMSLLRMQDLGGCRMVVEKIADVYKAVAAFKKSKIRHELVRETDYIQNPKKDGYRCVHLVYKYFSDRKEDYNGMLIEVQIRTKLQHLWATAIEILGLYTKYNLKASQGDKRILRYMELISALFAIEEKTTTSEHVPNSRDEILSEIKELEDINVLSMLQAAQAALIMQDKYSERKKEGYYILLVDHNLHTLKIQYFKKSDISRATEEYEKIEQDNNNNQFDAVLVSASSMDTLKRAYPNYFVDVSAFVSKVNKLIK